MPALSLDVGVGIDTTILRRIPSVVALNIFEHLSEHLSEHFSEHI